jgi:hypothetical protein
MEKRATPLSGAQFRAGCLVVMREGTGLAGRPVRHALRLPGGHAMPAALMASW